MAVCRHHGYDHGMVGDTCKGPAQTKAKPRQAVTVVTQPKLLPVTDVTQDGLCPHCHQPMPSTKPSAVRMRRLRSRAKPTDAGPVQ